MRPVTVACVEVQGTVGAMRRTGHDDEAGLADVRLGAQALGYVERRDAIRLPLRGPTAAPVRARLGDGGPSVRGPRLTTLAEGVGVLPPGVLAAALRSHVGYAQVRRVQRPCAR